MEERRPTMRWEQAAAGLLALFLLTGRWNVDRMLAADVGALGEPRLYVVAFLVAIAFSPAHRVPRWDARCSEQIGGLAAFLAYALSTLVWSPALDRGAAALDLLLLTAAVAATTRLCRLVGVEALSRSLCRWLGAILTLFGLLAILSGTGGEDRLSVLGGGPNVFGRNMALLAVVTAAEISSGRRGSWALAIVLPSALLIVLSGSRGALLAATAAVGLLLWHGRRRLRRTAWVAIAAASVGIIALSTDLGARALEVFSERVLRLGVRERYDSGRSEIYEEAWRIGCEFPVLGAGASSFGAIGNHVYPHNLFLELFCEYGLVALAAVLPILIGALRTSIARAGTDHLEDAVAFVVVLVAAQFSGSLYDSRGVFVFALLLCFRAAQAGVSTRRDRDAPLSTGGVSQRGRPSP